MDEIIDIIAVQLTPQNDSQEEAEDHTHDWTTE
jgi:hypothetical protein